MTDVKNVRKDRVRFSRVSGAGASAGPVTGLSAAVAGAGPGPVVVGVDTHVKFHHAVVVDVRGGEVADRRFPADLAGYRQLLAWASTHGQLVKAGVEGTGSYGAGLTGFLTAAGIGVVEVTAPDRQQRRLRGKSDYLDALHAARAAASGQAQVVPKDRTSPTGGQIEAVRLLRTERQLRVKQNTETMNALRSALITIPTPIRARINATTAAALARQCLRLRPHTNDDLLAQTAIKTLQRHARAWREGHAAAAALARELHQILTTLAPDLLAVQGVGPDTAAALLTCAGANPDRIRGEAAFAMLTGTAPIPASSGKTRRHRLSRGGDRQANAALYRIAIVRLRHDPDTRAYRDRAIARGKTWKDAVRLLKRYIARQLYPLILNSLHTPTAAA